jgi:hypothetical protein
MFFIPFVATSFGHFNHHLANVTQNLNRMVTYSVYKFQVVWDPIYTNVNVKICQQPCVFAFRTVHFLKVNEKTNKCMNHSVYWYSIFSYMFRHSKMPSSVSQVWSCWERCPMLWEAKMDGSCILWQAAWWSATVYSFHLSLLPATLDTYLSRIMLDSLMMAFYSAETCRRILSINT